jgi:hypothetical protein
MDGMCYVDIYTSLHSMNLKILLVITLLLYFGCLLISHTNC